MESVQMRLCFLSILATVMLALSPVAHAQTATVTATCKDGSAFSGTTRSGACRGHGGVKSWDTVTPSATAPAAGTATVPATGAATPPQTTRGVAGPGQVWVNTASKVYHCPGDRWYGKTKAGEYMSEAQAKSAGFHPDHNKACAS
jgi:hypothetical protein